MKYNIAEEKKPAMLSGLGKFEHDLSRRKLLLETDHKALEMIRSKAVFDNLRIYRQIKKIMEFDVKYIMGASRSFILKKDWKCGYKN